MSSAPSPLPAMPAINASLLAPEQGAVDVFGKIVERRIIDGRHDGSLFMVEAWRRANSEAFVHRIDVDGIPVPAGYLRVQHGMQAALDAGVDLACSFIDRRSI